VKTQTADVIFAVHSVPTAGWMQPGSTLILLSHPRVRDMYARIARNIGVKFIFYSPEWVLQCKAACSVPTDYALALIDHALAPADGTPRPIPDQPAAQPANTQPVNSQPVNSQPVNPLSRNNAPTNRAHEPTPMYLLSGRFAKKPISAPGTVSPC
jgi:hypothetical protein